MMPRWHPQHAQLQPFGDEVGQEPERLRFLWVRSTFERRRGDVQRAARRFVELG
jgi:hypothetical protein